MSLISSRDISVAEELLLIIGGFILSETIVRNALDVLGTEVSFWALGGYGLLIVLAVSSLRSQDETEKGFYPWFGLGGISLGLFDIYLSKKGIVDSTEFIIILLIGPSLVLVYGLFKWWQKNQGPPHLK